jgi:hypothetical protein
MTQEYLDNFAPEYGFTGAVRVSAKTGHNVQEAFEMLVMQIFRKEFGDG